MKIDKKKKLTKVENIGKFKEKVLHEFPCESNLYIWLAILYNKYKHLRDNKYNFMKKKLMHSVHNILEQALNVQISNKYLLIVSKMAKK